MGIEKVEDLLFHFPFRYDFHELKPIEEIAHDEVATIRGVVATPPHLQYYGRKKSRLTCSIKIGNVAVKAVFFNQPFLKDKLIPNEEVTDRKSVVYGES